jgi:uncharacterized membrane protein HdeD (DUF308 family)
MPALMASSPNISSTGLLKASPEIDRNTAPNHASARLTIIAPAKYIHRFAIVLRICPPAQSLLLIRSQTKNVKTFTDIRQAQADIWDYKRRCYGMDSELSNLTGGLVLRGVIAILFGIAAVFWPGITLLTLLYLFSVFLLIGGIFELVYGIGRLGNGETSVLTRILTPLIGLLQMGVGVYLLRHPHVTFGVFILLIGFTLIVRGVFEVVEGLFEEGPSIYRVVMIIIGLLAVLAGILILFQPKAAGVAFVWILGLYALISGALLLAGAVETHRLGKVLAAADAATAKR